MPAINVLDDGLTPKQREFAKRYVANGGNATKAALQSYNVQTLESASATGNEVLKKPAVRRAILDAFERAGITDDTLAKAHRSVLKLAHDENFQARSVGLRAAALAYKVRGDIVEQQQQQVAPLPEHAVNLLIQVVADLRPQNVTTIEHKPASDDVQEV